MAATGKKLVKISRLYCKLMSAQKVSPTLCTMTANKHLTLWRMSRKLDYLLLHHFHFSLTLYSLTSEHLDSPCSADRFPCHTGLAQLIVASSFKIILKFFTAWKKKLEICNFVPTCQRGLDDKNSFFEFFCSESHHPPLMYFSPQ